MGAPDRDLKSNLRRLDYALRKFGLTKRESGTTGHGARHDHLQGQYQDTTGTPAPVRGGGPVDRDLDRQARLRVARVAGHARLRSAGAYISAIRRSPAGSRDPAQGETGKPGPGASGTTVTRLSRSPEPARSGPALRSGAGGRLGPSRLVGVDRLATRRQGIGGGCTRRQSGNQPRPASSCSACATAASFFSAASGPAAWAPATACTTSTTLALDTC
jgi:hypothetical protein